jgi:hypothetical protein
MWPWKRAKDGISNDEMLQKVFKEARRTVNTYRSLLSAHPESVIDESRLPISKQRMITIFKVYWRSGQQEAAESWWLSLSRFQPTGKAPIRIPNWVGKGAGTDEEIKKYAASIDDESLQWIVVTVGEIEKTHVRLRPGKLMDI